MKQRIRLTESQLHNIIRKCVNEAVNELDPMTYASYADKRAAQGQTEKARQGRDAAVNAWNKKYGNDKHGARLSPCGNGYTMSYKDNDGSDRTMSSIHDKNYVGRKNGWDVVNDETANDIIPSGLQQGYDSVRVMNGRKSAFGNIRKDMNSDEFMEYNN